MRAAAEDIRPIAGDLDVCVRRGMNATADNKGPVKFVEIAREDTSNRDCRPFAVILSD